MKASLPSHTIRCPVCDAPDRRVQVATIPAGQVVRCPDCDVQSITPLPTAEDLTSAYQNFNAGEIAREEFEPYVAMSKAMLEADLALLKPSHAVHVSFLDYGCGGGHFVKAATELGLDAVGIDLDAEDAKFGALHGLEIRVGDYRDLDSQLGGRKYDMILMMHVLEHMPHPHEGLRVLASKLRPNGAIFIRVPDQKSVPSRIKIALRYFGLKSDAFGFVQPPVHLHGFTAKTFGVLARTLGLELIKVTRASALDTMEFPTTARYWRNLSFQKLAYHLGAILGSGGYLTAVLRAR